MSGILNRERFGAPQVLAGVLLLMFLGECCWLIAHQPVTTPEDVARVREGVAQWHGKGIAGTPSGAGFLGEVRERGSAFDQNHSPLWYLIEALPVAVLAVQVESVAWIWLTRLPYVLCGALLGASLWYVARRLYGNAGGYVALALYCFSPTVIRASTLWFSPPNVAGAWGTFGAVFTAIAVSHTLYAPREVVLWNWRRIVLLGISLALAVGSDFSLALVIPAVLLFMLYIAPERRGAALAILAAACTIGSLLLFASYFFHAGLFAQSLHSARLWTGSGSALTMRGAYLLVAREVAAAGPTLVVLVPAALLTFLAWRRARYFGNTAPLIIAVTFLFLRAASPHEAESVYSLVAVVFLFVFIAGIAADLLETKAQEYGTALLLGLLGANAFWNLLGLSRIAR